MDFATFVRKPFIVEAVEITEENIAEVAEHVGKLKENEDGSHFISVNRLLFPSLYNVYPGFWMTKMGDNVRCYSKAVFKKQFIENDPDIETWIKNINSVPTTDG